MESALKKNRVVRFPDEGVNFLRHSYGNPEGKFAYFHQPLVEFITKLIPTETDIKVRQILIDTLCPLIKNLLKDEVPGVLVYPCGSCMSGTFLSTSDIDLALFSTLGQCIPADIMDILVKRLREDFPAKSMLPLPTAKIPVLKFEGIAGIPIDLSIDELHGPLNVAQVRKFFAKMPCTLPAQLFFKCVLRSRGLDQPYRGGISSYTLQLMLIAYIQRRENPSNVTDLICGFCRFYGTEFNFLLTGIDVRDHGSFFPRPQKEIMENMTTLHIRDPLNPHNILGHNAFKMNEIADLFRETYETIERGQGISFLESLQKEIIAIEEMRRNADLHLAQTGNN